MDTHIRIAVVVLEVVDLELHEQPDVPLLVPHGPGHAAAGPPAGVGVEPELEAQGVEAGGEVASCRRGT